MHLLCEAVVGKKENKQMLIYTSADFNILVLQFHPFEFLRILFFIALYDEIGFKIHPKKQA